MALEAAKTINLRSQMIMAERQQQAILLAYIDKGLEFTCMVLKQVKMGAKKKKTEIKYKITNNTQTKIQEN